MIKTVTRTGNGSAQIRFYDNDLMNARSIGNEINVTIPLSPSQHRLPSLTSSQLSSLSSQHALLMVLTKGRGQSQDWHSHGVRVGGLAYNIDWIYLCAGRGTHSRRCLCSAGELLIAASWTLAWEKQVRYKRTKRAKKKRHKSCLGTSTVFSTLYRDKETLNIP